MSSKNLFQIYLHTFLKASTLSSIFLVSDTWSNFAQMVSALSEQGSSSRYSE